MSEQYLISNQTLTNIANAIREKKGSEDQILAGNFAEEILGISGDSVETCIVEVKMSKLEGMTGYPTLWCAYSFLDNGVIKCWARPLEVAEESVNFANVVIGSNFTIFTSDTNLKADTEVEDMYPLGTNLAPNTISWIVGYEDPDHDIENPSCRLHVTLSPNSPFDPYFTYSIANSDSADGGFFLQSNGFYQSGISGWNECYAKCTINFVVNYTTDITILLAQDSEAEYDFGAIGKVDVSLPDSYENTGDDYSFQYEYSLYREYWSIDNPKVVHYYNVKPGSHFIDVYYSKDESDGEGEDCMWFKVEYPWATAGQNNVVNSATTLNAQGQLVNGYIPDQRNKDLKIVNSNDIWFEGDTSSVVLGECTLENETGTIDQAAVNHNTSFYIKDELIAEAANIDGNFILAGKSILGVPGTLPMGRCNVSVRGSIVTIDIPPEVIGFVGDYPTIMIPGDTIVWAVPTFFMLEKFYAEDSTARYIAPCLVSSAMVEWGYGSTNVISVTYNHYEFDIDPQDYGFDEDFDTFAYCYPSGGGYDI